MYVCFLDLILVVISNHFVDDIVQHSVVACVETGSHDVASLICDCVLCPVLSGPLSLGKVRVPVNHLAAAPIHVVAAQR